MLLYDILVDILDKWLTFPFEAGQDFTSNHWLLSIEFMEQGTLTFEFHSDKQTLINVSWKSAW